MRIIIRSIALSLVLSLLSGPLGTLAYAQQPAAQPPAEQSPVAQQPAAPPPADQSPAAQQPAAQPPAAEQAVAQQPAAQPPALMQETLKMASQPSDPWKTAYDVGAGLANVAYVPGKMIVCGLGAVAGVALLLLTLGSAYKAAAAAGEEGCGGKWVLTGDDLRPTRRTEDMDRPRY